MTDRFVKERDYTDGATLKDEPVIAYGTTSFVDVVLAGGRGRMITLVYDINTLKSTTHLVSSKLCKIKAFGLVGVAYCVITSQTSSLPGTAVTAYLRITPWTLQRSLLPPD